MRHKMNNLNRRNEHRKVVVENVVFLQGDDYSEYQNTEPDSDIEYLLQWYYLDEHGQDSYMARDINTPFLGKLIKINGYKGYWLFSKNMSMGYIGLSRMVSFE
jgi:hypothetical protein